MRMEHPSHVGRRKLVEQKDFEGITKKVNAAITAHVKWRLPEIRLCKNKNTRMVIKEKRQMTSKTTEFRKTYSITIGSACDAPDHI